MTVLQKLQKIKLKNYEFQVVCFLYLKVCAKNNCEFFYFDKNETVIEIRIITFQGFLLHAIYFFSSAIKKKCLKCFLTHD
jgi:fumarate reductase subunit C